MWRLCRMCVGSDPRYPFADFKWTRFHKERMKPTYAMTWHVERLDFYAVLVAHLHGGATLVVHRESIDNRENESKRVFKIARNELIDLGMLVE